MKFMVVVKATKDSEAWVMPSTERLAAMGKFNEEMANAGVIKAGEGLHPTSRGARIKYAGDGQAAAVSKGPFPLSGDLIGGFWLIETRSLEEAIGWMKRAPFAPGDEIDIRQVLTAEDFGEALTPELREREERLRARVEAQ
ncbi:MAG TPA: YciI family protein [Bradyrhizobium sp.]|nr:YciI family protein [Bradyrhizobium sp.]